MDGKSKSQAAAMQMSPTTRQAAKKIMFHGREITLAEAKSILIQDRIQIKIRFEGLKEKVAS